MSIPAAAPGSSNRPLAHRMSRMGGRDPHEAHRSATPLELLFDLTFVVAFGVAGNEAAHYLADGHWGAALAGFGFAMFSICWAWINFSWFASAYDTDDWVFRLTTMVQMIGVLVLALGVPAVFESLDAGGVLDNGVLVAGYVVMRLAMVAQWLRAARHDPERRATCLTYAGAIVVAQVGWVVLLFAQTSGWVTFVAAGALFLVELAGPVLAERRTAGMTPWHPHHIAERYGLLTIITLGEGILGTVAALGAVVESQGWSLDAALVGLAGTALTFAMWWTYFVAPSGDLLHRHRDRSWAWGYGHIVVFAAIAATGAGLHVAAYFIEHEAHISATATVLTTVVPVAVYLIALFALYSTLTRTVDPFHVRMVAGAAVFLVLPVLLAAAGVPVVACLLVVVLAPAVVVVGYEVVGHRRQAELLRREASGAPSRGSAR